jgi:thermitase
MKYKRLLLSVILILLIPVSFAIAVDQNQRVDGYVPGEILIGFQPDVSLCQIQAIVTNIGGQIIGEIDLPDVKIRRVKLSSTTQSAMDATVNSLKTNQTYQDKIKYVEPNIIQRAFGDRTAGYAGILSQSSDPLLWDQWGYYDIGANWLNAPTTTTAPIIAIIDTGVDCTHPDLSGKVIKGYDYVNADTDPMDDYSHGTHVAGIAAAKANNAFGIAGVSCNSKILAVKVLNSQGWGTAFDISKGIIYAADYAGVKVLNMSLGGDYSSTEESAVYYAVNTKKKLLVAAAGNGDSNTQIYPAGFAAPNPAHPEYGSFPGKVLAVAAHDTDHCRAIYGGGQASNYGTWVSITAPGVGILSTVPNSMGTGGFDSWSGTSMASPFVAGAAAAAWVKYPTYKNTDIASLITTNTDTVDRTDPACWPNGPDDGTFQRLDLVNMLLPSFYNTCDNRAIYGFALNAENGEPLAGAKVQTTYGVSVTGIDFVPYYGIINDPPGDTILDEGYGLFGLALNYPSTPLSPQNLKIKKTGYAKPTLPVPITQCDNYAGNIPVPPNKSKYWLAVTWDYGYPGAYYDSFLYIPGYGTIGPVLGFDVGTLNAFPWAKHLWDSDYGDGNLRDFSEVIRIKKTVSGTYLFYIWDWFNGIGSTSWSNSGIKVYIYRWDPATLTQKLVKTYTPPSGAGQYWDICYINGNTITDINNLTDI